MTTKESDRELLTLAAKAAGIELFGWRDHWADFGPGYQYDDSNGIRDAWNPLTQDDDAFRLAVTLGITIDPMPANCGVWAYRCGYPRAAEKSANDIMASSRRAVVRVAAAIGKEK